MTIKEMKLKKVVQPDGSVLKDPNDYEQNGIPWPESVEIPDGPLAMGWREPDLLTQKLYPVMDFNPMLLPSTLQDWVADMSERMDGAPQDYAAVSAVVVLGGILGRKVGIYPKRHDDWLVIPNLWGAIVGRPSAKKTPLLSEVLKPIKRLEAEAAEGYDEEMKQYTALARLDVLQTKKADRDAAKKINEGDHDGEVETILLHFTRDPAGMRDTCKSDLYILDAAFLYSKPIGSKLPWALFYHRHVIAAQNHV